MIGLMAFQYNHIDVRPVSALFGAEIHGVNLATGPTDEEFLELKMAFGEYGVIFFRDQQINPEQHIAFAKRWGSININRFFAHVDGFPEIALILKEPEQRQNIGGSWHTDHTYDVEPAMGSILYACDVPSRGGDTLFANMYLAYDSLSDGLKNMLEGMCARHSSRHVFGTVRSEHGKDDTVGRVSNPELAIQDAVHPVIITHSETHRKALYVNPRFTVGFDGWTDSESKGLLDFLYVHSSRPELTCRFNWRKGSIAFWDNRVTWHLAVNDYQGERRLMHRITIRGSALN